MLRVVFVGMNPGGKRFGPKLSQSLARVERWAKRMGLGHFGFVNCGHWPGKMVPDMEFLAGALEGADRVVSLGREPDGVLEKLGVPHFPLPHPSGRNRLLNDHHFVTEVLDECERYLYR